jgi:hypothetical protein
MTREKITQKGHRWKENHIEKNSTRSKGNTHLQQINNKAMEARKY